MNSILEKHPDIGLIGPGNGILTSCLDGIFKRSKVLCTHAILHDAFGRVYLDYKIGPGYCYALHNLRIPHYLKTISILRHVTGVITFIRFPLNCVFYQ